MPDNAMRLKSFFRHWATSFFSPEYHVQNAYESFISLLEYDQRAMEQMALLEDLFRQRRIVDFYTILARYGELGRCVEKIVENLQAIHPAKFSELDAYFRTLDSSVRAVLEPSGLHTGEPHVIFLEDIQPETIEMVGGKSASLAFLKNQCSLPVPNGFVITTRAFNWFMQHNELWSVVRENLANLDPDSTEELESVSKKIRGHIENGRIPAPILTAMEDAYSRLAHGSGQELKMAFRSSALAEDSEDSFAGAYKSVLNVHFNKMPQALRKVLAGKYTSRAIHYRIKRGYRDWETPMAVMVLPMVNAAASGVIHTSSLTPGAETTLTIHAVLGLGQTLMDGEANSDTYRVEKAPEPKVLEIIPGEKTHKRVLTKDFSRIQTVPVTDEESTSPVLGKEDILNLAKWAVVSEKFFGTSQEMEWCADSEGRFYLLQSRPYRMARKINAPDCDFRNKQHLICLSEAQTASAGIAAGKVFNAKQEPDISKLKKSHVLVAENASPDYISLLETVSAAVTDHGSVAGHFATAAREAAVPVLVAAKNGTDLLAHGMEITVNANDGKVYEGIVAEIADSECAKKNVYDDSRFYGKLKYVMSFVSPLNLLSANSPDFKAHNCRSFHDIIRFCHEMAVREMFRIGEKSGLGKGRKTRKLISDIPLACYVLELGSGGKEDMRREDKIHIDDIPNTAFRVLWKAMAHPGFSWSSISHFDWKSFDNVAMAGGSLGKTAAELASYAIFSDKYFNLNLRFGYHFVIIDVYRGDNPEKNHILFRFYGGGGDIESRSLRAEFIHRVLKKSGFQVEKRGDLVDASFRQGAEKKIMELLETVGLLLTLTRLLDMYIKGKVDVGKLVEAFMENEYGKITPFFSQEKAR